MPIEAPRLSKCFLQSLITYVAISTLKALSGISTKASPKTVHNTGKLILGESMSIRPSPQTFPMYPLYNMRLSGVDKTTETIPEKTAVETELLAVIERQVDANVTVEGNDETFG